MSRMFEVGHEVLWYDNDNRCYGTVDGYTDNDQTVVIWTVKEDGEPVREYVREEFVRDSDDPDDPEPTNV